MDSLAKILDKSSWQEPEVIEKIKQYVSDTFHDTVGVSVGPSTIVITTKSASLAGALRLHTPQLQILIATDKKIVLRIS